LLPQNLLAKFEVQLAYAIGVAQPVSIRIDTFGTGTVSQEKLIQAVREKFLIYGQLEL
jgi:S-adenosylmethionine synthetase